MEKINIMGHVSKSGGAFSRKKRKVENKGNRDASSHHKLNCPAVPSDARETAASNVEHWVR